MQPSPADTPLVQTHHSHEPAPCRLGRYRCTLATQARLSRHGRIQDEYSWRLGGEEGDGVGKARNMVAHKASFVHCRSKHHAKKRSSRCAKKESGADTFGGPDSRDSPWLPDVILHGLQKRKGSSHRIERTHAHQSLMTSLERGRAIFLDAF